MLAALRMVWVVERRNLPADGGESSLVSSSEIVLYFGVWGC